jgi:SIR2-like domain
MSVGLPSWHEFIEHLVAELELDSAYLTRPDVTYQTLAEFYRLKHGSIGPLRSWLDRTWSVSEENVRRSKIHELIVGLDFPLIYTTNYDNNLEVAYRLFGRDYVKVANARDVAHAAGDVTQIIKFHGDFDDDTSLVIAETDYFERLSFDAPLDIKFRADALGRTILFIGYSMSDLNIRLLLHQLWRTWRRSRYEQSRPPSYVFTPRRDPVQEAVLGQWGISVLSDDIEEPEAALREFLTRLTRLVQEETVNPP